MTRLDMFSIFDTKAKAYLQPFFSANQDTATREFTEAVNKEGGQFNKYAEDYSMFYLGQFDQESGKLIIEDAPVHCVNAVTLKAQSNWEPHQGIPFATEETTPNV